MKLPFTLDNLVCTSMDLIGTGISRETGKIGKLSKEDAMIRLLELADELEDEFCLSSIVGVEGADDERAPATIVLSWSEEYGYEANVLFEYVVGNEECIDIDLSDVPMINLKEDLQIPDYNVVIERGLEIINTSFDVEKFLQDSSKMI